MAEAIRYFIDGQIEYFNRGYRVIETEVELRGIYQGLRFEGIVDRVDKSRDISYFDYRWPVEWIPSDGITMSF